MANTAPIYLVRKHPKNCGCCNKSQQSSESRSQKIFSLTVGAFRIESLLNWAFSDLIVDVKKEFYLLEAPKSQ
jgi:hypothetical protein